MSYGIFSPKVVVLSLILLNDMGHVFAVFLDIIVLRVVL